MSNATTGARCGCGDCREYRLWRIERADEWEPTRDWDRGFASARDDDFTPAQDSAATETGDVTYAPLG